MKILWFIPTHGDSRYLGTTRGARAATLDYFKQIAIAADSLGYEGVLIPTGRSCEDSWILAASLIDVTRRLNSEIAAILKSPDVAEKIASQGGEIMGGSSEDFAKFLATDTAAFARLIKDARITLE